MNFRKIGKFLILRGEMVNSSGRKYNADGRMKGGLGLAFADRSRIACHLVKITDILANQSYSEIPNNWRYHHQNQKGRRSLGEILGVGDRRKQERWGRILVILQGEKWRYCSDRLNIWPLDRHRLIETSTPLSSFQD